MLISRLIELLAKPLYLVGCFFVLATLYSRVFPPNSDSLAGIGQMLLALDLTSAGNLASWFVSLVILVGALSSVQLVFARSSVIKNQNRVFYMFLTLVFVFFAAAKVTHLHLGLGALLTGTKDGQASLAWMMLFAPSALLGLLAFSWVSLVLMSQAQRPKRILGWMVVALVAVPFHLFLDGMEKALWGHLGPGSLLAFFEEILELLIMASCITTNNLIAKGLKL